MAQTNFTPILLYASSTPTNVPSAGNLTNSATGSEIAINIADKNLFFKDSSGIVNTVPIRQSSTSSNGWLSSTDWNTFNNKAPATSGTSILYGNGSGGFSNVTIGTGISFAGGTLSATGSGGTVTSVTGTSPVVSSGGTTPAISLATAYGDTLNPYASKTANYVLAAPNGSAGVPTFRALVSADIPSLSGTYIPYTGASSAIDLNTQTVTNIAHLGINSTAVPEILFRAYGDNNSTSRIAIRGYSSNASSSSMRVAKFRGTFAAPQAPQSGDSLGKFELAGYGTTSSSGYPQVSYEGVATENWGATARGAKALFYVTPNTTTTQAVALTIDQDKSATFANTVTATTFSGSGASLTSIPNSALVNSAITINGTSTSLGGSISVGTVTSVTGTAPVVSSGGATPAISMAAANTTTNGYLTSTDWNTFNSKGSGSVTSVAQSFTGGLISVAGSPITSSGTLALTVAGTSGGIPYFSSATTWATSAALAASALVIGGGAGVAPSTITTGTGVVTALGVNTGTAGAFVVNGGALGTPSSGTVTNLTGTASININGTVGATTPAAGTFTSLSDSGNLTFTGTGNRITGDFSNGTLTNRVALQTSTVNSSTNLHIIPNGTSTSVGIKLEGDSAIANGSRFTFDLVGGSDARIGSGQNGTGTYLPITIYTSGSERVRIFTSGGVSINNTTDPGAGNLSVSGYIYSANFYATNSNPSVNFTDSGNSNYLWYIQNTSSSIRFFNQTGGFEGGRFDNTGGFFVGYTSGGATTGGGSGLVKAKAYNCKAGYSAALGSNSFNIDWTGSAQLWIDATNIGTITIVSDYRIKKNVETQTLSALSRIERLRPVTYERTAYKNLFIDDGVIREGFIAHELQTIIPSAVDGEKDALDQIQSLNLDALCSVMVKAIQELNDEVNSLKQQIMK